MAGIGKKIEENHQLQEFTERILSYAFDLAINGEFFITDICEDMDITEDEMYELFKQLGYNRSRYLTDIELEDYCRTEYEDGLCSVCEHTERCEQYIQQHMHSPLFEGEM